MFILKTKTKQSESLKSVLMTGDDISPSIGKVFSRAYITRQNIARFEKRFCVQQSGSKDDKQMERH